MGKPPESPGENESQSLYERIGGEQAITDLVVEFYVKIFSDPELAPFFKQTKKERLHTMQREFFSAALDGPIKYSGKPLRAVHAHRGITPEHMKRFVGYMFETLEGFDIGEDDRRDVIARINTYADEIMGGYGTGG